MRFAKYILLLLLACQACDSTETTGSGNKFEPQVDSIFAGFAKKPSPGCAVAVFSSNELIFMKGYGLANLEHAAPITPQTVFDIASVSKQFAAYAAASLVEAGLIDPADPISKYLPEMSSLGDLITVGHLIHHTSGLRDWPQTLAVGGWSMEDELTYEQILRMAFLQQELNYTPGDEYSYTNTGYVLLAELVSRVAGQPFGTYIDSLVYQPLGMKSSYFNHDVHTVIPNRAQSYYTDADGTLAGYTDNTTAMGSSSMFASVEDVATWLMFLARNKDTDPVVKRMHMRGVLNNGDTIHYAYGIWMEAAGGLPVIAHTGSWAGFRAITMRFPTKDFGLVILSNYSDFDRYYFAGKLAKVFLGDDYLESDDDNSVNVDGEADTTEVFLAAPRQVIEIERHDTTVAVTVNGVNAYQFTANPSGEFEVDDINGLHLTRNGDVLLVNGVKATRQAPPLNSAKQYLGTYYSPELMATYTLLESEEGLVAYSIRHGEILLKPLAEDVFEGSHWFLSRVVFTRSGRQVSGFEVFGGRVRRLAFSKVDR